MEPEFDIDKILSDIDEDGESEFKHPESDVTEAEQLIEDDLHRENDAGEEDKEAGIPEYDEELPVPDLGEVPIPDVIVEEIKDEELQDEQEREEKTGSVEEETTPVNRNHGFTVKGTRSWNTREPYLINISDDKLKQLKEYFSRAFFFIREDIDEETVKSEIKRSFAGFMRNPSKNISEEYKEFIFKLIISEVESIIRFFNIPDNKRDIFIYHVGPFSIHKSVISKFKKKMGLAYRYDVSGRRAVSFFPDEYIKLKVLEWYEENINKKELQFDSVQIVDELTTLVSRSYHEEKKKFSKKLNKINYRLGPGKMINSQELLRLKGDEWFGSGCIEVYKRFISKTIFR